MKLQYSMISSVEFSISLPYARFGCDTLSASGGLVFTLYVLLISVIIAEILCLAVFQIIASIVSQTQRFYSEYEWLDSFMIGSTIDALEETTPPTLDSETIESALITLKVRTNQFANKKEELDQIQQCAICLCDYGECLWKGIFYKLAYWHSITTNDLIYRYY